MKDHFFLSTKVHFFCQEGNSIFTCLAALPISMCGSTQLYVLAPPPHSLHSHSGGVEAIGTTYNGII